MRSLNKAGYQNPPLATPPPQSFQTQGGRPISGMPSNLPQYSKAVASG